MSDDQRKTVSDNTRPVSLASNAARVMGGIFQVFGFLVMTLTGLCTGAAVISMLPATMSESPASFLSLFGLIAAFGGIPFIVGFALFWLGRRLRQGTG